VDTPDPDHTLILDHVFAEPTQALERQAKQLREEIAGADA
jgi:hypothetical protein